MRARDTEEREQKRTKSKFIKYILFKYACLNLTEHAKTREKHSISTVSIIIIRNTTVPATAAAAAANGGGKSNEHSKVYEIQVLYVYNEQNEWLCESQ